jgi:hypothetical protein
MSIVTQAVFTTSVSKIMCLQFKIFEGLTLRKYVRFINIDTLARSIDKIDQEQPWHPYWIVFVERWSFSSQIFTYDTNVAKSITK